MKQAAGKEQLFNPNDVTFQYLQMVATICNNSSFLAKDADGNKLDMKSRITQPDFNVLQQQCSGDASESGLIKFVNVLRDIEDYRQAMKKLFEIKFNSTNKWQLSIHAPEDSSIDYPILALKGAPERVLKMCKKIIINVSGFFWDFACVVWLMELLWRGVHVAVVSCLCLQVLLCCQL